MDVRSLAKCMLVLAACGPSGPGTAATGEHDSSADSSSSAPTGGGEENGPAPVCLSPQPDGVATADGALQCVSPDALSGTLGLIPGDWPEVVLDDCEHGTVEVDVPCTATQIVVGDADAVVSLECTDDDSMTHALTIAISTPALFFPVCAGQALRLQYARNEYGCPNGGHSEAMVLRAADTDTLLAATFYDAVEPWLAPLEISSVSEPGCTPVGDACLMEVRGAVQVDDGINAPVIIYDGTRQLAELAARYVIEVHYLGEFSSCGDETFGTFEVALARAEP